MRAVVLVGGEGTRLRPLTLAVPKQMLPVAGVSMIERVLDQLAGAGIDDVVLSMGYRPDAFLAAFPDNRAAGVKLTYAVEPEPRDTAGAIRFAAVEAGIEETFLVVNGDVLTDLDIGALVKLHRQRGGLGTISLTPVEDPSAFGVVPTDADGRVQAFIEKPRREDAPTNLINAGTYVLEPAVLERIAPDGRVSVEKETFPALVGEGALFAVGSDEYWLDTGTPALYLRAVLDIVSGARWGDRPPRPGLARGPGGSWVAEETRIDGEVGDGVLLEEGVLIGAGAVVRRSHLGAGVTVAAGARIEGSVVMGGTRIGPEAVVEESVVGGRSRVGAGARLSGTSVVGWDAEVPDGAELDGARFPAPA